jgi:hypothetical protein
MTSSELRDEILRMFGHSIASPSTAQDVPSALHAARQAAILHPIDNERPMALGI